MENLSFCAVSVKNLKSIFPFTSVISNKDERWWTKHSKKWLSVSYYMHSAEINYHCISYRISCLGLEAATQSCSMKKLL